VAQEISERGSRAAAFELDVTDSLAVSELPARVEAELGKTCVLVNCAGWDEIQPFVDADAAFWEKVIAINLTAVVAMTHAFFADLTSTEGRLVNIASDAGRVGSKGETIYAGAKGGVVAFTKSVGREMAGYGATANCVCPGPVRTSFLTKNPPRRLEALERAIPMRRIGEPEDVWPAVRLFASADSGYITGQVLSVSGGLTMNG
jgi:2-hydroxycyclohexanecarboxyl-CoA dehydrogenase